MSMEVDMEDLLTTGGTAKRLGLSADRVRQLERDGKLPARKTQSGQRLFNASDVDRFARRRETDRSE